MFQRPVFVIAGALGFTPILLRNSFTYPITAFLEHQFWYPLARLSYGAYLSHGIFMLYRTYNAERGTWACELDAFFLFMAYLSFAFLFSFLITVIVEMPCHNLYQIFVLGRSEMPVAYYGRAIPTQKASKAKSFEGDESDAETLDTVDDSDRSGFSSQQAAYKQRSKLVLDNQNQDIDANISGQNTRKVNFKKTKASKQKEIAEPAINPSSASLNRTHKRYDEISEEKKGSKNSAQKMEDDGLYFLE